MRNLINKVESYVKMLKIIQFPAQLWSASGVAVLSREFRPHGQILLCEVRDQFQADSVFALLPESMFRPESAVFRWLSKFGPALVALLVIIVCVTLLLSSALLQRHA